MSRRHAAATAVLTAGPAPVTYPLDLPPDHPLHQAFAALAAAQANQAAALAEALRAVLGPPTAGGQTPHVEQALRALDAYDCVERLVSLAAVSLAEYLHPEADVAPEGRATAFIGAEHLSVHDGQGQPEADEAEGGA